MGALLWAWELLQRKETWMVAAGFVAGGLILGLSGYNIGWYKGDSAGYARYVAEQAVKNHKAEQNRKSDDAAIQNQSDYDACVAALKRRGLQLDACEQLRGIHT